MYDGRVVVGYDGSPQADLAVSWAAAEAALRGRGLTIVHAILPIKGKGSSDWGYSWVPIVGPIIGGVLAGLLAGVLLPAV